MEAKESIKEKWKTVEQYPKYEVSNTGRIRRKWGDKYKYISAVNMRGYYGINISNGRGKQRLELVHRLVAKAFIPNPDGFWSVRHIDGNNLNNNYTNLEWIKRKTK